MYIQGVQVYFHYIITRKHKYNLQKDFRANPCGGYNYHVEGGLLVQFAKTHQ